MPKRRTLPLSPTPQELPGSPVLPERRASQVNPERRGSRARPEPRESQVHPARRESPVRLEHPESRARRRRPRNPPARRPNRGHPPSSGANWPKLGTLWAPEPEVKGAIARVSLSTLGVSIALLVFSAVALADDDLPKSRSEALLMEAKDALPLTARRRLRRCADSGRHSALRRLAGHCLGARHQRRRLNVRTVLDEGRGIRRGRVDAHGRGRIRRDSN
jgi:hypothetical protein